MSKQKPVGLFKKLGLGLLAVGLLVVFVHVLVVRPLQIRHQKQQFAKAEAGLDQLYNQIVAKVGKPDQYKKERSCGYASRVYVRGPRGCGISLFLLYANKDAISATDLTRIIYALSNTGYLQRLGNKNVTGFVNHELYRGDQILNQDYLSVGKITCGIQYTYPLVSSPPSGISPTAKNNLLVELSCGGPAMAEFYPVKN